MAVILADFPDSLSESLIPPGQPTLLRCDHLPVQLLHLGQHHRSVMQLHTGHAALAH